MGCATHPTCHPGLRDEDSLALGQCEPLVGTMEAFLEEVLVLLSPQEGYRS